MRTWAAPADETMLLYPLKPPRPRRRRALAALLSRHPGRRARKALRW